MASDKNIMILNLPFMDYRNNDLIRVVIKYKSDDGTVVDCTTPNGRRIPASDNLKSQLKYHIQNCSERY